VFWSFCWFHTANTQANHAKHMRRTNASLLEQERRGNGEASATRSRGFPMIIKETNSRVMSRFAFVSKTGLNGLSRWLGQFWTPIDPHAGFLRYSQPFVGSLPKVACMVAKFFIFLTKYFFIAVFDPSQYDKQDPPESAYSVQTRPNCRAACWRRRRQSNMPNV